jgi:putative beta-lysine N-acetyltransferase
MVDAAETLLNSSIQHGKLNNRIFLLKLAPGDGPAILPRLDKLAEERGYTKIVAKIPSGMEAAFIRHGYTREATIPGFFNAGESGDAVIMAKYTDPVRGIDPDRERLAAVLAAALKQQGPEKPPAPEAPYGYRIAMKTDADQMAKLYAEVFPTYPFPIHNPDYIAETMEGHSLYVGIWKGETLVSLASADMDIEEKNAEMTDFATLPHHRGRRFAEFLLKTMEAAVAAEGVKTCYTIARARSFGMNITFSRAGYTFSGVLINNTNISGRIESMNIWYKRL